MLKFEHVTKVYGGKKALNDLSISFQSGHVYALVGPNGSGKSTMMKAAAGLVKVNTGSVTYQDMPIGVESKKHISYMSTEPFYYDYMKIRDVGQFYADFFEDFDESRFASLLQFMQLTPDLKVKALSSGMAAKLKIAATLSRNAEVCITFTLMLSEPEAPSAFQVPLTLELMPCPLTVVPISSPSSSVPSKLRVKVLF